MSEDTFDADAEGREDPRFTDWLGEYLDPVGPTLSARRQQRVARLFERTVAHEVAFFDAAHDAA